MSKRRVGVYVPDHIWAELEYLTGRYGVTAAYILLLSYKLSDRKQLELVLSLSSDFDNGN